MTDQDGKNGAGESRPSKPPPGGASPSIVMPVSPMFERPSRREVLKRVGLATGVLAGSAVLGRAVWDRGGFGVAAGQGARQVRDYRLHDRTTEH
ncbi:MAG TPA: twin-arginine translocation signal domain-containing protein, partial [Labilithrix sp.]|nr:twin-arginine translocation signal domain-containing protein [Labilithrix sp.]